MTRTKSKSSKQQTSSKQSALDDREELEVTEDDILEERELDDRYQRT